MRGLDILGGTVIGKGGGGGGHGGGGHGGHGGRGGRGFRGGPWGWGGGWGWGGPWPYDDAFAIDLYEQAGMDEDPEHKRKRMMQERNAMAVQSMASAAPIRGLHGLDVLGAVPAVDSLAAPAQVILSPHGAGSTVYGDPMGGRPSGVTRIEVSGGTYWAPQYNPSARTNWDDSQGSTPTATVYFADGTSRVFAGLQAVNAQGGVLKRGVVPAGPKAITTRATPRRSFWARIFHPRGEG